MKLEREELQNIYGGVSAAFVNSVISAFKAIFDFGRKVGSTLRRAKDQNYCKA